ncbi:hypothetical protein GCM10027174_00390 [Salinifilum aidingensis]
MAVTGELADLRRLVGQLRSTVNILRVRHGEHPQLSSMDEDVERLEADIAALGGLLGQLPQQRPSAGAGARPGVAGPGGVAPGGGTREEGTVFIPETAHDPSLWQHVDDEGLGGQVHGG